MKTICINCTHCGYRSISTKEPIPIARIPKEQLLCEANPTMLKDWVKGGPSTEILTACLLKNKNGECEEYEEKQ